MSIFLVVTKASMDAVLHELPSSTQDEIYISNCIKFDFEVFFLDLRPQVNIVKIK